jgi:hypothetical protein
MTSATATVTGFPLAPRAAAEVYLERGLAPIPLPHQRKAPVLDGWQHLRLTPATLDAYFPAGGEPCNVGVLNGEPSGNTADADLDCPEARRAAPYLLPPTGWVFGRPSAPRSHWLYRTDVPLDAKAEEYKDLNGAMLVELRGTRSQTVFPPSVWRNTDPPHNTEPIRWDTFTEPAVVALADLWRAVRAVAVVALLARYWPEEGWHNATLALAGGLLRGGVPEEEARRLVEALWRTAGTRDKPSDRDGCVRYTAQRLTAGKEVTGWPTVAELLGERGEAVIRRVREWLGIRSAPATAKRGGCVPSTRTGPFRPAACRRPWTNSSSKGRRPLGAMRLTWPCPCSPPWPARSATPAWSSSSRGGWSPPSSGPP